MMYAYCGVNSMNDSFDIMSKTYIGVSLRFGVVMFSVTMVPFVVFMCI